MLKRQSQTTHRNLPRQAAPEPGPRFKPTAIAPVSAARWPAAKRNADANSVVPPEIIERLEIELAWFDDLLPGHRLPLCSRTAAVMQVMPPFDGWIQEDARRFAEKTRLKDGTQAYMRAEFRNVLYAMARRAREWNNGRKGPYYFVLYSMLSACGYGPHPDRELIQKWRSGLTAQELKTRERGYRLFFNHLRNRVCLVRKALDPESDLPASRRPRILSDDPLIADGERARQDMRKQTTLATEAS